MRTTKVFLRALRDTQKREGELMPLLHVPFYAYLNCFFCLFFFFANKYFTSTKWTATDLPTNKFYRSRKFKCLNLTDSITTAYTVAGAHVLLENAYLAYVRKFCRGVILRVSQIEKKMKFRLVLKPTYFNATPSSTWDQAHLMFFSCTTLRRL